MRKLFENISLAVFLNLGIKSAWILVNNIVQDRIGHKQFGLYMALYALGMLFMAFADFGLNQYTTKTLASDKHRLKSLFPHIFGIKLVLSAVYPFFMLGVGAMLGYDGQRLLYLFLLCLMHGMIQISAFFRSNFQAFQKFRADALFSVLDRTILLGIILVLLSTEINLESYIYANLASVFLALGILYLFTVKLFGAFRPRLNKARARELLKGSLPFMLITILYSVNEKVDQVMIERIHPDGEHETGLYAGAYRWVDAFMMYLWTVLPIFFAKFAANIRSFTAQAKLLQFGQPIAAIPILFVSVFVFFYGEKLLWLFKNSTDAELNTMIYCLKVLFIAVLINGFFAIYSTLLTSTNHVGFVSRMVFISILLNMGLNFIFIPEYGAMASAWSTVASFAFLSLSYMLYILFRLPVKFPLETLIRLLVVAGVFTACFFGLHQLEIVWYLTAGISGLILLALTWFAGLIKLNLDVEN